MIFVLFVKTKNAPNNNKNEDQIFRSLVLLQTEILSISILFFLIQYS